MRTLGRFIFWDFPRASWQYDVMVALILAFVFAVPRDFFQDEPKAASVVMLPNAIFIKPELLNGVPKSELNTKAAALLNERYKNRKPVTNVEPMLDSEGQIIGYAATVKP